MKTSTSRWLALVSTLAIAACGPSEMMTAETGPADTGTRDTRTTEDEGPGPDTMEPADTVEPPMDATPTDTPTPTDTMMPGDSMPPRDSGGPPGDPCAASAVIDLATAGMRTGNTVRYTGTTAMTASGSTVVSSCQDSVGHVLALRYTPMTASRISISTDNMGTAMGFDTVVWAQATCAQLPDMGTPIACNDDGVGVTQSLTSLATSAMPVTAGTPIFIFVGGYAGFDETTDPDSGAFALTITEIAEVAAGAACDPSGRTNFCATGSLCVAATGSTTMGTCVADGAMTGRCRATGMACNSGLACNGTVTSTSSRCVPLVPAGMMCDTLGRTNACAAGSTCEGTGTAARCVAEGASGGRCRTTGMACDSGLACSTASFTARCRPSVAVGMPCDSTGAMNACAAGSNCLAQGGSGTTNVCIADGAANGRCRAMGMACDTGFACSGDQSFSSSRCRMAVAVGGMCDTASTATTACAAGSLCVRGATGTMGTCVADGGRNGRCRSTGMACEAGLACNGTQTSSFSRCLTAVMPGGACDPDEEMNACAVGSACLGTEAMPICVADGARDGHCRSTGAACDMGLACSGNPGGFSSYCVTAVDMGGACDLSREMNACALPLQCVPVMGSTTMGTCQQAPYAEAPLTGADATFIDACTTGSRLMLASTTSRDDTASMAAITLPFAFRFFGTSYMSVWPTTNGMAAFSMTQPSGLGGPDAIPSTGSPRIAPFWQDLVLRPSPMSDLCTATVGTAPNRRVVIQWANAQAFSADNTFLDFEAVLNENGSVDFIYRRLEAAMGSDPTRTSGANASIGLQDLNGTRYARHTGTITAPSAIRFTPR